MALESDERNPDSLLNVQIYDGVTENTFQSSIQGRKIMVDVVRIKIRRAGDTLTEIDRPLMEEDKARFPMHWQAYLNHKNPEESQAGTPISELTFLSSAAIENLKIGKFYTVEQVAFAPDSSLAHYGMLLGMDPLALREKCKRYLEVASKNAPFTAMEAIQKQQSDEMEALKAQLKAQADLIAELQEKRGPGRPKKEAEAA